MSYAERLENVTVLGAAGKMGSGIVLLTALEMADLALDPAHKDREFTLNAVDISSKALTGLVKYLRAQVLRTAEKKTVALRAVYADRADLIENEDIIRQYVEDVLAFVRPTTRIEAAHGSTLVFEAVNENPDLKVKLLAGIKDNNSRGAWFLTNTSSIPISELDARIGLGGRIVGFHFYNPPAVQKLVEVIRAGTTLPELAEFAAQYAKKLRKTVVASNDVAGFIGNGHFMRDALHGIADAERLSGQYGFVDAVYMVNKVSQEFLIRPMGIFQLVDYVGLDVCRFILGVMNERLPGQGLRSPLVDGMLGMGVAGGQFPDGSQKDGFLKYEKGRPAGVFNPDTKAYVPLAEISARCDERLGPLPSSAKPWKGVIGMADKAGFLEGYFKELRKMDTLGADLAREYGRRSKEIGLGLVRDGVARKDEDVNTVMLTGFYHAYGPVNGYFD
ncbi:MAG: 3-hydroxyacyl-CoA dehydrogenase family protein [Candidatus Aminicenantes bacterium]|nr:3-hydroxyacyl-CoA dehydrogenase family protein [Candidatus Aminicenantes bacterium]